ncbi:uncharacterized protein LOC128221636 [Mya arenaria]|uniref:uncharacterized protein LOC128221636 n=1 Tax=Mya arenaria TaxID=6604 RepID=UPI0022E7C3B7|nr:uncharacterized protein LOC128221636 [Mya arenaria]
MPWKRKKNNFGLRRKKGRRSEPELPNGESTLDHEYCQTNETTIQTEAASVEAVQTFETMEDDHNYSCIASVPCDVKIDSDYECIIDIETMNPDLENESELIVNETDIAENVVVNCDAFDQLYDDLREKIEPTFVVLKDHTIRVLEHYKTTVKTCLVINKDLTVEVLIHNRAVAASHSLFSDLGKGVNFLEDILTIVNKLKTAHVCIGCPEQVYVELVPEGSYISSSSKQNLAYRDGNFGAERGTFSYNSTVRAVTCDLVLVTKRDRCIECSRVRAVLRNREYRRKEAESAIRKQYTHSNYKHSDMDKTQLILKINEQKNEIKSLHSEVNQLKRQLTKKIQTEG